VDNDRDLNDLKVHRLFQDIIGKMDLNKIIKNPYAISKESAKINYLKFYKECIRNMDHGLPLLKKINNKLLRLQNYTLTKA